MAKWKKTVIGSICKAKEAGNSDYLKVSADCTLKQGTFLNLENEAFQLKNLQEGIEAGRIGSELEKKLRDSIQKTPFIRKNGDETTGFVRFQIVQLTKNDD